MVDEIHDTKFGVLKLSSDYILNRGDLGRFWLTGATT
jgi:hypothetical protein